MTTVLLNISFAFLAIASAIFSAVPPQISISYPLADQSLRDSIIPMEIKSGDGAGQGKILSIPYRFNPQIISKVEMGIRERPARFQKEKRVGEDLKSRTPSTPITLKLQIAKAPRLDEDVLVTGIAKSAYDAPRTVARVELPKGAILVSGKLNWTGDLVAGVPVELSAIIRFIKEGNWIIRATAIHKVDEQNSWGDVQSIYLNVTKESGKFGFSGSPQPGGQESGK